MRKISKRLLALALAASMLLGNLNVGVWAADLDGQPDEPAVTEPKSTEETTSAASEPTTVESTPTETTVPEVTVEKSTEPEVTEETTVPEETEVTPMETEEVTTEPTEPGYIEGSERPYEYESEIYIPVPPMMLSLDDEPAAVRYTVVILDTSGSMGTQAMNTQKAAAIKFCESMMNAGGFNYIALVELNTNTKVLQSFTDNMMTLRNVINNCYASGGTNTGAAIKQAGDLLDAVPAGLDAQRTVVLCSDGLAQHGPSTPNGPYTSQDVSSYYGHANTAYNEASALKLKGYTIYTLGFFHNISSTYLGFGQRFMKDIASSPDKCFNVKTAADLNLSFDQIAGDLLIVAQGTCGTNLKWVLRDTGELTISGTGAMTNYSSASYAPWYSFRSRITSVTIEDGVTSIGNRAFYYYSTLKHASIPGSVKTIGDYSFYYSGLLNADLPEGVEGIGSYAFYSCKSLESITIPSTVTSFGSEAFRNSGMKKVTLLCHDITIPNSTFFVENSISRTIREVHCASIADWISNTYGMFGGNPLEYAAVPDLYLNGERLTNLVIPEGSTSIGGRSFIQCKSIVEVTLPKSLTFIGSNSFEACSNIKKVNISDMDSYLGINFGDNPVAYSHSLYLNGSPVTKVKIPDGITTINNYTFYNLQSLQSIEIPDSVKSIGTAAFYACTDLTEVIMPDSVSTVGVNSFANCTSLRNVRFSNSLSKIPQGAFMNDTALTEVTLGKKVSVLGGTSAANTFAFYGCKNLETLTILYGQGVIDVRPDYSDSSTDTSALKMAFSTASLPKLKTIYVPATLVGAYQRAWGPYLPSTISFELIYTDDMIVNAWAAEIGYHSFKVRWDAVEGATSYNVYSGTKLLSNTTDTSYVMSVSGEATAALFGVTAMIDSKETELRSSTAQMILKPNFYATIGASNYVDASNNSISVSLSPGHSNQTLSALSVLNLEIEVNGQQLDVTKESTGKFSSQWNVTPETVPAKTYQMKFRVVDPYGYAYVWTKDVMVDYSTPSAVRNVTAMGDTNKIVLGWQIAAEAAVNSYKVYRSTDGQNYTLLKTVSGRSTLGYTDTAVTTGNTYYYYVVAATPLSAGLAAEAKKVSAAAMSDKENPSVTSMTPETNTKHGKTVEIHATASDNIGVARIELYYAINGEHAGDEANDWQLVSTANAAKLDYTLDTTALEGSSLFLKAVAYDLVGNVSLPTYRTLAMDHFAPDKVKGVTYAKDEKSGQPIVGATYLQLTWDEFKDENGNVDVAGFIVEQKQADGSYKVLSDNVKSIGYRVENLQPDKSYTFRISAFDDVGNVGPCSDDFVAATSSDTKAPVVTKINLVNGEYNRVVPVSFTVEDEFSVTKVILQVSSDKNVWNDAMELTFDGSKKSVEAEYELSLAGYADGLLYVRAMAWDAAGNSAASNSYGSFMVDKTPPAMPTDFTIILGMGELELNWKQGDDAYGYNLYRGLSAGNVTLLSGPMQYISYLDRDVQANTTYYYELAAVDKAGNESGRAVVSGAPVKDEINPHIKRFTPEEGAIGGSKVFAVNAEDNWKIANITATYQVNGGEAVAFIDQNFNGKSVTASKAIPMNLLHTGDTIKIHVVATDVSGNKIEDIYTYTIDVTAPVISNLAGQSGNGSITLTWNGGSEADLDGYYIYRSTANGEYKLLATSGKECSFVDNTVSTGVNYNYKVTAEDKLGNVSFAVVNNLRSSDVLAVLECEANMETDTEYVFSAAKSSAVNAIAKVEFDFGDGTTAQGTSAAHRFTAEGTYTVKVTVTDTEGNVGTAERQVVVTAYTAMGELNVKVVSPEGSAMSGATVYFDYDNGLDNQKVTNGSGTASFKTPAGEYSVGVFYSAEYLPLRKSVVVYPGVKTDVTIVMTKQPVVTGSFNTQRVEIDKLVGEYGIDPEEAANKEFVEVNVNMVFGEKPVSMVLVFDGWENFNYNKVKEYIIDDRMLIPVPINPVNKISSDGGSEAVPPPTFVAVLDVPVNASYEKEFFDVKLYIMNNADENFTVVDNVVKLNIPDGMTLVATPDTLGTPVATFGALSGQQTKMLEWVFRGDKKGNYTLSANYTGLLQEFQQVLNATFQTITPIRVYGNDALRLNVDMSGKLEDKMITFTVGLENKTRESDPATVYLPTLDVLTNLMEVTKRKVLDDGSLENVKKEEFSIELDKTFIREDGVDTPVTEVKELKPGQQYCKTYIITVGDEMAQYAQFLQAIVKETVTDMEIKFWSEGLELEHNFVNYYSDNNATCYRDGTKTAKCDNDGCTAEWSVTDTDSRLKVPHHFVNGVCVNCDNGTDPREKHKCDAVMSVKVEYLNRLGSPYKNAKTYSAKSVTAEVIEVQDYSMFSGYEFKGWELDGVVYSEEEIGAAIVANIPADLELVGTTYTVQPKAIYEKSIEQYMVNVDGGTLGEGGTDGLFELDASLFVRANEPAEGMYFDHWEMDGKTVSNAKIYYFYMPQRNITLKAVYAEEEKEELGTAMLGGITGYPSKSQLLFSFKYTVPVGSRAATSGLLATCNASDKDNLELGKLSTATGNYTKTVSVTTTSKTYNWTKTSVTSDQIWYVRGYVTYTSPEGVKRTIYTPAYRATMEGFEVYDGDYDND